MNALAPDFTSGILDRCEPPCLSLYQPTHRHHPDNLQDPIRFENLVKVLEESLLQQFSKEEIRPLLEPFLALGGDRDFWNHTHDGLAVLGAKGLFRVYTLSRQVAELAVVANSFHSKPLMRILQSTDRHQILGLNRKEIRLFEGNRDALYEIEPAPGVPRTIREALGEAVAEPHQTVASYGGVGGGHSPMHHGHGGKGSAVDIDAERFFRAVDRAVLEQHSRPSGLPLILAALPEHQHLFHEVSHNPLLIKDSIDIHPDALPSTDELRQRAWQVMEPRYLARLADLVEAFGQARSQGLGDDEVAKVAEAVVSGRVATLLIEASREVPGRINAATGDIELDDRTHPEVDDVLDDLGALTLKRGGQVVIVPPEQMPTKTGLAAIYRYRLAGSTRSSDEAASVATRAKGQSYGSGSSMAENHAEGLPQSRNTKQSSPKLASLAASTMNNTKASKTAKQLAASVLSQAEYGKQTGVELQTLASRVLQDARYSIDTKSLAASVLSQSTKDR